MEPLISVIVTVYKVEEFLPLCLESIQGQTYRNLEILLIDDGSPDNCPAICDAYGAKDARIKVIHKKNKGVADTRNVGLDNARGKYLLFIDGDDSVDSRYVEYLYQMLTEKDVDIAACAWQDVRWKEVEQVQSSPLDPEKTIVWNKQEALQAMLYQVPIDCALWAKLYRRELFDGIRMPVGKQYEDMNASYRLFERVQCVSYNPYPGYRYLLRDNGIMRGDFSERKMDLIDFAEELKNTFPSRYPQLENAVWSRFFRANCHIYLQIPGGKTYRKYRKRIEKNIVESRWKVWMDPNARKGTKMAVLCTYLGFPFFRAIKRWKEMGKK